MRSMLPDRDVLVRTIRIPAARASALPDTGIMTDD